MIILYNDYRMWIQKQAESLCWSVSTNMFIIIITLSEYVMLKNKINQFTSIKKSLTIQWGVIRIRISWRTDNTMTKRKSTNNDLPNIDIINCLSVGTKDSDLIEPVKTTKISIEQNRCIHSYWHWVWEVTLLYTINLKCNKTKLCLLLEICVIQ